MATHTFYLDWQAEYDYQNSAMLTAERERLLKVLKENGFERVSFVDCWNSERYLHDDQGREIIARG